jgi:hypothetical protein
VVAWRAIAEASDNDLTRQSIPNSEGWTISCGRFTDHYISRPHKLAEGVARHWVFVVIRAYYSMQFTCVDLDMRTSLSGRTSDLSLRLFAEFLCGGHGAPSLQFIDKKLLIKNMIAHSIRLPWLHNLSL